MVKLSLRLKTIVNMTPESVVADVGSDHGKLMIALYEEGKIKHGYAIENKKGPYNRLLKALIKEGLEEVIIPLFSNGLDDLPGCVNTLIIAGMGGLNIINILKAHPRKLEHIQTIIIDAHSQIPKVREAICKMGYVIADEKMVKEDEQYYEIIRFMRADVAFYSDDDITFGPILRQEKNATFKEKYISRIRQIDDLLATRSLPEGRLKQLNDEKKKLLGVI